MEGNEDSMLQARLAAAIAAMDKATDEWMFLGMFSPPESWPVF